MNIIEELQSYMPNYIHVERAEPEAGYSPDRVLARAVTRGGRIALAFTWLPDKDRRHLIPMTATLLTHQFETAGGDYIPVPKCDHGVVIFDAKTGCVECVTGGNKRKKNDGRVRK